MKRSTYAAIGRIKVLATEDHVVSQGTGFLVSCRHVLTAFHTVCDRTAEQKPYGPTIHVTFRTSTKPTHWKLTEYCNPTQDWALLELIGDLPITNIEPIPLRHLDDHHQEFETHGFPLVKPDGKGYKGKILHPIKQYEAADAHELEVLAATGTPIMGLSGAPIIVRHQHKEFAVGVLRSFLGKDTEIGKEVIGGALYACPSTSFLPEIGKILPVVRARFPVGTDPAVGDGDRRRGLQGNRSPRQASLDVLTTKCFQLQQRLLRQEMIAKRWHVCLCVAALALSLASLFTVSRHSAISVVVAAPVLFSMVLCYYALVVYPLTTVRQCMRDSTLVVLNYESGGIRRLSSTASQVKCSDVLHIMAQVFCNGTPGGVP